MTEPSLGRLVGDLIGDLSQLVRQEIRLVQAEVSAKLEQAQNGVYAILSGLLIGTCALLILLQAVVVALARIMPDWLAAVCVGGVLAVIAILLIRYGRTSLKARNLMPRRSLKSIAPADTAARESKQQNS